MKHVKFFEELSIQSDPEGSNDVFKIRYRSLDDLSTKKSSDTISKPINDLLDGIDVGDTVIGIGIEDNEEHTGNVIKLQKDEKGENVEIEIEEEGEVIELSPGSVKFAEGGDKGNSSGIKAEPNSAGNIAFDDYTSENIKNKITEMKTKPFDGVKMDRTKDREYKIGNKKLSKKLKNIKMFEEFSEEFSETELEEGLFSKSKEEKKKDLEADFKK